MKLRLLLLCIISCIFSCANDSENRNTAFAETSAQLPFRLGPSCFSRVRSNYDDWARSVVSRNNKLDLATFKNSFPREEYDIYRRDLDCHFIVYKVDGLTIRGIYARRKAVKGTKLPVVIVNRGGNGSYGAWHLGRMFHSALPLASDGFVVIGSQYRGSRKGATRETEGNDEFGGEDINDVLALFGLIDRLPGVDPARIGMLGWSRGGIMTFIAATRTERLRAIAVGGTPTDLSAELLVRPEMERVFRARIPNYDDQKEAALTARSALKWAGDIDAQLPILILHGESDKRVSLNSAVNMAGLLRELDRPVKLVVYKDGTHGLMEHREEVRRELTSWFEQHLAY